MVADVKVMMMTISDDGDSNDVLGLDISVS